MPTWGEKCNLSLAALAAYLNSSVATIEYRRLFDSLHMNGDALRIGPPQLKKLPIPSQLIQNKKISESAAKMYHEIAALVARYLRAGNDPALLKRTIEDRSNSPETSEILKLVKKLDIFFETLLKRKSK